MKKFLRTAWQESLALARRMKYGPTCYNCGKPIPESSLLIDYCLECGKTIDPSR